ncbi:DUF7033 domain-containing protein [Pseudoalteromonas prydzensis]|uniref:DUF7033 domain-containing protein n=1 Tax=Pseudoalteromonas prydzensis TaxID=182141 RepID=UPI0007E4E2E4|nr:hypothetical protein [Pseudoalteromonas prydzensis]MBE0376692.1 hypothetical protein [Pseudoalteromonas prydzensis ACAM 620]
MNITLQVKSKYVNEIEYISKVFFSEIVGVSFVIDFRDDLEFNTIILPSGKKIYFPNIFFDDYYLNGRLPESVQYLKSEYLSEKVPIFFGLPSVDKIDKGFKFGFDILGTCFFLLTCYEEFVNKKRDCYGRFLHAYSCSNKLKYVEYPIVDQFAYLIRCILIEDGLNISTKSGSLNITCDVDWPYDNRLSSLKITLRTVAYLLIKKKRLRCAINLVSSFIKKRVGWSYQDEYRNAVTFIMEQCETLNKKGLFYFIPKKTHSLDTDQTLLSQDANELLNEIHSRGHLIGCHPGFLCSEKTREMLNSYNIFYSELRRICGEGIVHNRNHFLKWDINSTARELNDQGVDFDSTLGFSDHIGFRCGTAYDFTMFDLKNREMLKIKQRPLIIMDASVFHTSYQYLDYSVNTEVYLKEIVNRALRYGGNCTLLWHNTHLLSDEDRNMYKSIIMREELC